MPRTPFPRSIRLSRDEALDILAALIEGVVALQGSGQIEQAFRLLDQALVIEAKLVEGGDFPEV